MHLQLKHYILLVIFLLEDKHSGVVKFKVIGKPTDREKALEYMKERAGQAIGVPKVYCMSVAVFIAFK